MAWTMAAAIVMSAPFVQQAFTAIEQRWPQHSSTIVLAATVIPALFALTLAVRHIRESRARRLMLLAAGIGVGIVYYQVAQPIFTEAFHFTEYGILALLFYRAARDAPDWSALAVPVLGCVIAGSVDEWFQWFIPHRAGDARDVAINALAGVGGVLFALGVWPPLLEPLHRASRLRLATWGSAALVVFAAFFHTIHMGHDVADTELGSFRSRFTRNELLEAAADRDVRWRAAPPVEQQRLSREDQYLTEGLWRVAQRNDAWDRGDAAAAWRENRILEKFYAPVLAHPTYEDPRGHRWPEPQRADAQNRLGGNLPVPRVTRDYRYALYSWEDLF